MAHQRETDPPNTATMGELETARSQKLENESRAHVSGQRKLDDPKPRSAVPGSGPERSRAERSHREREVLRLLAAGHTDQQIATLLGVSYQTVTTHVGHLFTELGVRS